MSLQTTNGSATVRQETRARLARLRQERLDRLRGRGRPVANEAPAPEMSEPTQDLDAAIEDDTAAEAFDIASEPTDNTMSLAPETADTSDDLLDLSEDCEMLVAEEDAASPLEEHSESLEASSVEPEAEAETDTKLDAEAEADTVEDDTALETTVSEDAISKPDELSGEPKPAAENTEPQEDDGTEDVAPSPLGEAEPEAIEGSEATTALDEQQDSPLYALPGSGPGLVWMLETCGIMTLEDLAAAEESQLREDLGLVGKILDVAHWIDFAKKTTSV